MKIKTSLIASIGIIIFSSGCSTVGEKYPNPDSDIKRIIEKNHFSEGIGYSTKKIMPYQNKTSLMVESRSNEAKVIINAGKVLKILICPYKHKSTLIAGHDIYTYVEKPGFIVGASVPTRSTDGLLTSNGKLPFYVNHNELNINDQKQELSNKDVKSFINNLYKRNYGYKSKNYKKIDKLTEKKNQAIMDYIKAKKKDN